jgi:hypothetical protein
MKAKTSKAARKFMQTHIRRHMRKYHMPQKRAVAAAYSEARAKGFKVGKQAVGKYENWRKKKNEMSFGFFDD